MGNIIKEAVLELDHEMKGGLMKKLGGKDD